MKEQNIYKVVVYKDGSYKHVKGYSWEFEADPDWLTTIHLGENLSKLLSYLTGECRNPNIYFCMDFAYKTDRELRGQNEQVTSHLSTLIELTIANKELQAANSVLEAKLKKAIECVEYVASDYPKSFIHDTDQEKAVKTLKELSEITAESVKGR